MRLPCAVLFAQPDPGATANLLRAHGRDVDKKKSAFDRSGLRARFGGVAVGRFLEIFRRLDHPPEYNRPRARGLSLLLLGLHVCAAYAATSTLIVRGFASSRNGSVTVSTPFLNSAATFAVSTVFGSVKERWNVP